MFIRLVKSHEFLPIQLLGLVKRDEADVLWWESIVCEGALDRVEVVRTNPSIFVSPYVMRR